jgi:hypothetical protein
MSCSKDDESLDNSIWIADPEYQGLPQYSEWGYNTFGAYYDREVFVSNEIEIPLKVIVTDNTTTFLFKGQKGSSNGYYNSDPMNVRFIFPGFNPQEYTDLLALNDSTLEIGDYGGDIQIYINDNLVEATILNGQIDFKRVQKLVVDAEEVQLIMSGYFFFQLILNNEPISVSNGRFDIGVGASNFFAY